MGSAQLLTIIPGMKAVPHGLIFDWMEKLRRRLPVYRHHGLPLCLVHAERNTFALVWEPRLIFAVSEWDIWKLLRFHIEACSGHVPEWWRVQEKSGAWPQWCCRRPCLMSAGARFSEAVSRVNFMAWRRMYRTWPAPGGGKSDARARGGDSSWLKVTLHGMGAGPGSRLSMIALALGYLVIDT